MRQIKEDQAIRLGLPGNWGGKSESFFEICENSRSAHRSRRLTPGLIVIAPAGFNGSVQKRPDELTKKKRTATEICHDTLPTQTSCSSLCLHAWSE